MDDLQACCIDERCTLCGACVEVCAEGALALGDTKALLVHPEDCAGCGICELVCPTGAIQCSFVIVWDTDDPAKEEDHDA